MRIEIAAFSEQGYGLGERIARALAAEGETARLERCGGDRPLRAWTAERFFEADALVFVGAAGIAVRAVAPHLVSKTSDPAVVAVDDRGRFAVSLLSGHLGGANELAQRVARMIGATPVVTTGTDGNGVFAVDVWAARNGLALLNPERIKAVSGKLLAGGTAGLGTPFPVAGSFPDGVRPAEDGADIRVDIRPDPDPAVLSIVPPVAVLGIGCRKSTPADRIENAFLAFCGLTGIHPRAFGLVASADLKQGEPGLVAFCRRRGIPFRTYPREVLAAVPGEFSSSGFVEAVAGVGTVCERAAVAGAGGGGLAAGKTVVDGVALAAAVGGYVIRFPEEDRP